MFFLDTYELITCCLWHWQPKVGSNVTNSLCLLIWLYFLTFHIGICWTLPKSIPPVPAPWLLGPCICLYVFRHFVHSRKALDYPPLSNLGTTVHQSFLIWSIGLINPPDLFITTTIRNIQTFVYTCLALYRWSRSLWDIGPISPRSPLIWMLHPRCPARALNEAWMHHPQRPA